MPDDALNFESLKSVILEELERPQPNTDQILFWSANLATRVCALRDSGGEQLTRKAVHTAVASCNAIEKHLKRVVASLQMELGIALWILRISVKPADQDEPWRISTFRYNVCVIHDICPELARIFPEFKNFLIDCLDSLITTETLLFQKKETQADFSFLRKLEWICRFALSNNILLRRSSASSVQTILDRIDEIKSDPKIAKILDLLTKEKLSLGLPELNRQLDMKSLDREERLIILHHFLCSHSNNKSMRGQIRIRIGKEYEFPDYIVSNIADEKWVGDTLKKLEALYEKGEFEKISTQLPNLINVSKILDYSSLEDTGFLLLHAKIERLKR